MKTPPSSNPARAGSLGDTPIHTVLSGIEEAAQDARAWFETEYGMGEVLFHKGKMVNARLGGARAQTALLRLMAVNEGRFAVEDCAVAEGTPIVPNVQSLIELHSVRKVEWKELCSKAPPLSSVLRLTASGSEVRDSARGIQRVVLVLIDGRRTLMQVLEESSFDPVEALRVVVKAVDDDLTQIAPQATSLFPLAPAGDASGVLPRFTAAQPASTRAEVGPPSWRHATLVGLGAKSESHRATSGLAPAPIIDVGRRNFASRQGAPGTGTEARAFVQTVIQGFGTTRGDGIDAAPVPVGPNAITTTHSGAPRQRIVDVTSGPPESSPATRFASSPKNSVGTVAGGSAGGQRRYVDRYEILLRIGRGGMGTVYLARLTSSDVGFRRLYALKLLRSHLSRDAQAAKEFLEEAKVAGVLHHANVVAVCDAGFHGKQPYLVMEYVEGCSFKHLMQRLPQRSPQLLLPIMLDALSGLHAAHTLQDESGSELRLVHCDVSPENMLVGVDGTCRLTDFGMVTQASRLFGTTTKGKPGYVAPERVGGELFDHRSDIFSMGVVLWSALTGKQLFAGDTIEETIEQVCRKPILPPSAAGSACSPALDAVVMKALARNPKDRFSSADEMAAELFQVARSHDGLATPKEIASWVREAAGAELTQQRLAILDATRSNPSVPPTAGEEVARAVNATDEARRDVSALPSLIESSVPPGPRSDRDIPELVSSPNSSMMDVGALFYDRDRLPSLGPVGPSSSAPTKSSAANGTRFLTNGWLAWSLVAALALVVCIILLFLNARLKGANVHQGQPAATRCA